MDHGGELIIDITDNIPNVCFRLGRNICQIMVRILLELRGRINDGIVQITCIYHNQQVIISIATTDKNNCLKGHLRTIVEIRKMFTSLQIPVSYRLENDIGLNFTFKIDYSNLTKDQKNHTLIGELFEKWLLLNSENAELRSIFYTYLRLLPEELKDLESSIMNFEYETIRQLTHKMQSFPGGFHMEEIYFKIKKIHQMVTKEPINKALLIAEYISLKALADELIKNENVKLPEVSIDQYGLTKNSGINHSNFPVLLADDNPLNCEMISYLLTRLNLPHKVVFDGQQVLSTLEQSDFAVLLIDFQMPVLDGPKTIKTIRAQKKFDALIIVGITTFEPSFNKQLYRTLGCDDFLFKPFTEKQLSNLIQQHIPVLERTFNH